MKKIIYILTIVFFSFNVVSHAQCAFTHTEAGNTTTLNYPWTLVGNYSLDSVHIDYGDGNSILQVMPVPTSVQHTYTNAGTYNVCLTRYLSLVGNPSPIVCTFCDSVTISALPITCFSFPDFSSTHSGLQYSFTSTGFCYSCVSQTYRWDFGDGTILNNANPNENHTYTQPGTYNACLIVTGTSASNSICTDTICYSINIPPPCLMQPSFNYTINGQSVTFQGMISWAGSCWLNTYSWNFGDGSNYAGILNPTHVYTFPGTYTVCFSVEGDDLYYSTTHANYTCITIQVVGGLGLNQSTKQYLQVYPNPANNWLYIHLPTNEKSQQLRLYDMFGRMIQHVSLQQNKAETYTLTLSKVSAGIYTLQLETDSGTYNTKVYIQQ